MYPKAWILTVAVHAPNMCDATKMAAISAVAQMDAGVKPAIGTVNKSPRNPLFQASSGILSYTGPCTWPGTAWHAAIPTSRAMPHEPQDKPWEPRLDNGYPNVVPPDPSAAPGSSASSWQMWYGDCVKGCGTQILLYANSSDGLEWEKPSLGQFDIGQTPPYFSTFLAPDTPMPLCYLPWPVALGLLLHVGLGGISVYRDPHEKNVSRKYKAFGPACYPGSTGDCISGDIAVSSDGLLWNEPVKVGWPAPQRYDCHNNLFWDLSSSRYIATTRDGFSQDPGRTIGITNSKAGGALEFDATDAPPCTLKLPSAQGTESFQLYSQITFPWLNTYLGLVGTPLYCGIVMVLDADQISTQGRVHCRLAWANDPLAPDGSPNGWKWVDPGGLTGQDFVPLGGSPPTPAAPCASWSPVNRSDSPSVPLDDCPAWRSGSTAPHYVCSTPRIQVAEQTLQQCRSACQVDTLCQSIQWQGLRENAFDPLRPGQCFLMHNVCDETNPYDDGKWKDFCIVAEICHRSPPELIRGTSSADGYETNPFDSHVCFAAHSPVSSGDMEWVYYMGGNGPHSGARNTSLALATLRKARTVPDGFASLSGTGSVTTVPILVSGSTLIVTADFSSSQASLRVGASGPGVPASLGVPNCVPINCNATDAPVHFSSGADFSSLVGHNVTLQLELHN
eukprot:gene1301-2725_t